MELKIVNIKPKEKDLYPTEIRVSDEELDICFSVNLSQKELDGENWVEKAKQGFLLFKDKTKTDKDILKNFVNDGGLIKHKILDENAKLKASEKVE